MGSGVAVLLELCLGGVGRLLDLVLRLRDTYIAADGCSSLAVSSSSAALAGFMAVLTWPNKSPLPIRTARATPHEVIIRDILAAPPAGRWPGTTLWTSLVASGCSGEPHLNQKASITAICEFRVSLAAMPRGPPAPAGRLEPPPPRPGVELLSREQPRRHHPGPVIVTPERLRPNAVLPARSHRIRRLLPLGDALLDRHRGPLEP